MKKLYIQPTTLAAVYLPQSNVLLKPSGSGPEPAPMREFSGDKQSLKYLI